MHVLPFILHKAQQNAEQQLIALENGTLANRLPTVLKRKTDAETLVEIQNVIHDSCGPSQTLQGITCILKNAETVNSILIEFWVRGENDVEGKQNKQI